MARKNAELDEAIDAEAMVAHLSGSIGVDFGRHTFDTPLSELEAQGSQGILEMVKASVVGREATVRDIGVLTGRASRVAGTPEQIADALAAWQAVGVDGINVINATIPGSYEEFIDAVLPELRKRGLARTGYEPGTLRRKLFGRDRLPTNHPAAAYRGAFRDG